MLCALVLNLNIWLQVPCDFCLLGMMEDLLSLIMVIKGVTRWQSQVRAGWWSKMVPHSLVHVESSRNHSPFLIVLTFNVHSRCFFSCMADNYKWMDVLKTDDVQTLKLAWLTFAASLSFSSFSCFQRHVRAWNGREQKGMPPPPPLKKQNKKKNK